MKSYSVNLRRISLSDLSGSEKLKYFLYADFNVLNFLYEKRLNIPSEIVLYYDSTALQIALWLSGNKNYKKQVSTDFLFESLKLYRRIYLFGASVSTLNSAKANLLKENSSLEIIEICEGYNYNTMEVINSINNSRCEAVYVGLGLERQENWILQNHNAIHKGIIFSCGGWFEYLAGQKKRAPYVLRMYHLEWLHKLFKEFTRTWKRYFLGFPLFIFRVITKKITFEIR